VVVSFLLLLKSSMIQHSGSYNLARVKTNPVVGSNNNFLV